VGILTLFTYIIFDNLNQPLNSKYDAYYSAANWLNDNVPPNTSVATNEIGILAFYYENGSIIDGLGLVTEGVASHVAQQDHDWYIHEYQPDYMMFDYPHRPILEDMVDERWFQSQYDLVTLIETEHKTVAIYQHQDSNG
jgi:hypothetical protein